MHCSLLQNYQNFRLTQITISPPPPPPPKTTPLAAPSVETKKREKNTPLFAPSVEIKEAVRVASLWR
jgi:hypothetical protein